MSGERQFSAVIYCDQPETRWFHRHVLRRRWQRYAVYAGLLDALQVERAMNNPTKAVFRLKDPMEDLLQRFEHNASRTGVDSHTRPQHGKEDATP